MPLLCDRRSTKTSAGGQNQAEQGDAESQSAIGLAYKNGSAVAPDPKQAASWFRKSAEQGYAARRKT